MLEWLENQLRLLNPEATADKEGGYTRLGFSKEEQLSEQTGVEINIVISSNEKPVFMDDIVINKLKESAETANKSYKSMISGAGHDAMNMAQRWSSGMVFIPCQGISHNPAEYTETINLLNGVKVLTN